MSDPVSFRRVEPQSPSGVLFEGYAPTTGAGSSFVVSVSVSHVRSLSGSAEAPIELDVQVGVDVAAVQYRSSLSYGRESVEIARVTVDAGAYMAVRVPSGSPRCWVGGVVGQVQYTPTVEFPPAAVVSSVGVPVGSPGAVEAFDVSISGPMFSGVQLRRLEDGVWVPVGAEVATTAVNQSVLLPVVVSHVATTYQVRARYGASAAYSGSLVLGGVPLPPPVVAGFDPDFGGSFGGWVGEAEAVGGPTAVSADGWSAQFWVSDVGEPANPSTWGGAATAVGAAVSVVSAAQSLPERSVTYGDGERYAAWLLTKSGEPDTWSTAAHFTGTPKPVPTFAVDLDPGPVVASGGTVDVSATVTGGDGWYWLVFTSSTADPENDGAVHTGQSGQIAGDGAYVIPTQTVTVSDGDFVSFRLHGEGLETWSTAQEVSVPVVVPLSWSPDMAPSAAAVSVGDQPNLTASLNGSSTASVQLGWNLTGNTADGLTVVGTYNSVADPQHMSQHPTVPNEHAGQTVYWAYRAADGAGGWVYSSFSALTVASAPEVPAGVAGYPPVTTSTLAEFWHGSDLVDGAVATWPNRRSPGAMTVTGSAVASGGAVVFTGAETGELPASALPSGDYSVLVVGQVASAAAHLARVFSSESASNVGLQIAHTTADGGGLRVLVGGDSANENVTVPLPGYDTEFRLGVSFAGSVVTIVEAVSGAVASLDVSALSGVVHAGPMISRRGYTSTSRLVGAVSSVGVAHEAMTAGEMSATLGDMASASGASTAQPTRIVWSWGSVAGASVYPFRFRPAGSSAWVEGQSPQTSVSVSHAAHDSYEFQVAASDGAATSEWSVSAFASTAVQDPVPSVVSPEV